MVEIILDNKMVSRMASENDPIYNEQKLLEELLELAELLIKKTVKRGLDKEPTDDKVIEELGDVVIRIFVYIQMKYVENPTYADQLAARIGFKMDKYLGYYNENKYTGKI